MKIRQFMLAKLVAVIQCFFVQCLISKEILEFDFLEKELVLKTDDIHPPKTGISVHFSCSLS